MVASRVMFRFKYQIYIYFHFLSFVIFCLQLVGRSRICGIPTSSNATKTRKTREKQQHRMTRIGRLQFSFRFSHFKNGYDDDSMQWSHCSHANTYRPVQFDREKWKKSHVSVCSFDPRANYRYARSDKINAYERVWPAKLHTQYYISFFFSSSLLLLLFRCLLSANQGTQTLCHQQLHRSAIRTNRNSNSLKLIYIYLYVYKCITWSKIRWRLDGCTAAGRSYMCYSWCAKLSIGKCFFSSFIHNIHIYI